MHTYAHIVAHVHNYGINIHIKQKHTMLLYHNIYAIPTHKYTYGKDILKIHDSICTDVIMLML